LRAWRTSVSEVCPPLYSYRARRCNGTAPTSAELRRDAPASKVPLPTTVKGRRGPVLREQDSEEERTERGEIGTLAECGRATNALAPSLRCGCRMSAQVRGGFEARSDDQEGCEDVPPSAVSCVDIGRSAPRVAAVTPD
jgi:hypothetical protein